MTRDTVAESLTLEQRIERAEQEVVRLCGSGPGGSRDRNFRMTVPVELDRDSDMVLIDGLKAGREALARLESAGLPRCGDAAVLRYTGERHSSHHDWPEGNRGGRGVG